VNIGPIIELRVVTSDRSREFVFAGDGIGVA